MSGSRDDGKVRFEVRDSGEGFAGSFLSEAFEPFSRAPKDGAEADGAGLGLAIVRAIASAHGGTATAENRPEGGATVWMSVAEL